MTVQNQISEEIQKLNSLIKTARKMTVKGTIADISAIKNNVKRICDLMNSCDTKNNLINPIEKIIEGLDFLSTDLTKNFGWLSDLQKNDINNEL